MVELLAFLLSLFVITTVTVGDSENTAKPADTKTELKSWDTPTLSKLDVEIPKDRFSLS